MFSPQKLPARGAVNTPHPMSWPLDLVLVLHLFLNYSMFDTVYNKFAEFRGF